MIVLKRTESDRNKQNSAVFVAFNTLNSVHVLVVYEMTFSFFIEFRFVGMIQVSER